MNRFLSRSILPVLFFVSANLAIADSQCPNVVPVNSPLPGIIQFRVNMHYDPTGATTTQGPDVAAWQTFLLGLTYLTATNFTSGVFDAATEEATIRFQTAAAFPVANPPKQPPGVTGLLYRIRADGVVTWATYFRAVEWGFNHGNYYSYNVNSPESDQICVLARPNPKQPTSDPNFRRGNGTQGSGMGLTCTDTSAADPDVMFWQDFLVDMGYLNPASYPNGVAGKCTFDSKTYMATEALQSDFQIYGNSTTTTGVVDLTTFSWAEAPSGGDMTTYTGTTGHCGTQTFNDEIRDAKVRK